jgi:hypothetical protein
LNAILDGPDGASLDDTRFTVVLNTFKRRDLLKKAVAHYVTCASVAEIRVVWSEQAPPPTENDADARSYFPKSSASGNPPRVRYDARDTTSIQNRFEVADVHTSAVFNVDDDVRMPCAALAEGFEVWKKNRDVLVGYFPRMHAWSRTECRHQYVWDDWSLWRGGQYSIVLTKAAFSKTQYLRLYSVGLPKEAREYVDERKNCEDIAMQLLTSAVAAKPPVYVKQPAWHYWLAKLEGFGVAGISKGSSHHDLRGDCVTDLTRILFENEDGAARSGETPLVAAPF